MKSKTLGRIFATCWGELALLGCVGLAPAAESEAPLIAPMGNNTCGVTRSAKYVFTRSTQSLKYQATEDAANFCARQHRKLQVVSITEEKPSYLHGGVASVRIIFTALDAGDPELAGEPAAVLAAASSAPVEASEKPAPTDDFGADLGRLDDLHNEGFLTDKEYAAAKKRILARIK